MSRMTAVASSGMRIDDDGAERPAGTVHAWMRGSNQTVCGLRVSDHRLETFADLSFVDVSESNGDEPDTRWCCPKCLAAGARRDDQRWTRRTSLR